MNEHGCVSVRLVYKNRHRLDLAHGPQCAHTFSWHSGLVSSAYNSLLPSLVHFIARYYCSWCPVQLKTWCIAHSRCLICTYWIFPKAAKFWLLAILAQTAITKYRRLGGLNNRHFFPPVRETEKSDIRVPAWRGSGALFLACRWYLLHLLCSCMAERERFFLQGHWSSPGHSTIMASSEPNYLLVALSLNAITLRVRASPYEFSGDSFHL